MIKIKYFLKEDIRIFFYYCKVYDGVMERQEIIEVIGWLSLEVVSENEVVIQSLCIMQFMR